LIWIDDTTRKARIWWIGLGFWGSANPFTALLNRPLAATSQLRAPRARSLCVLFQP
jgi:hypothetical protein